MGVRAKSRAKYAVIQQGPNRRSNDQHGPIKQSAHSAQAKTKRHNIYRRNSAKRSESCAAERMTEGSAHWPWSSPYSWCQRRRLPCQTTRATPARRWPRPPARSTARSTTPRPCAPTSGSSYSSRKTWRQCRPSRTPTSRPAATTRSSNTHRPTIRATIRATWRCRQASDV